MNLSYLIRVFRARGIIVLVTTLCALTGGIGVLLTTAPRYDGSAKVELTYIKPDPITGFAVRGRANAIVDYIEAQMAEVRSLPVAARAAENLGWMDSPELQDAYAALPPSPGGSFQQWVAQRVADGTSVRPIEDSNLLEIRYRAVSPEIAKVVAGAVRDAYIQNRSAMVAANAQASLPGFSNLAADASSKIAQLEVDKATLERSSGVIIQDNKTDMDSLRLKGLATSVQQPFIETGGGGQTLAETTLAKLDFAISDAKRTMGPNNPMLLDMEQRRTILARQIEQQRSAKDAVTSAIQGQARNATGQMATQMSKVLSQSDARMKLQLIQDAIDYQHKRYSDAARKVGELQAMVNGGGGDVRLVGPVDAPLDPAFPNKPLILGGAGALGLIFGLLLAFVAELWKRRVRTERELGVVAPGLAIISIPDAMLGRRPLWRRRRSVGFLRSIKPADMAAE